MQGLRRSLLYASVHTMTDLDCPVMSDDLPERQSQLALDDRAKDLDGLADLENDLPSPACLVFGSP